MQGATPSNTLNGLSPCPLLLIPALGASASVLHCHLSKQSCSDLPQLGPLSDASKQTFTQTMASAVRKLCERHNQQDRDEHGRPGTVFRDTCD